MRNSIAAAAAAFLMFGGVARAQSAPGQLSRGYAEANIQSSFGNVTSQSFGGELGITITGPLQVWAEGGYARDAASADIGTEAQQVAGALSQTQAGVTYGVKQPVTFGVAGARYVFQTERVIPYVLAGIGAAQVKNDVTFAINGSDVTASIAQYGIVLGSRLTGNETKAMLALGGGVQLPLWQRLVVDLQYRYGRIFTDVGTNLNRAGVGIGVRF